jgi:tRNA U34 5-methylaminomethyl-2-thiouridine-forming methyltransferase MnmC
MKIISTGDGSSTIYMEDIDETYHSRNGAIQESIHVFVKNGFRFLLSTRPYNDIQVFELGFGTGLNAVLTAIDSIKFRKPVKYTSLEPFPLPGEIIDQLDFGRMLNHHSGVSYLKEIHNSGWEEYHNIHPYFRIRKIKSTIQDYDPKSNQFNLVYFDAFAPAKQPEIWDKNMLTKIFNLLTEKSVFVTYCAQGQVKRHMREIGFKVQTLQGPPGKKEMIRGIKA